MYWPRAAHPQGGPTDVEFDFPCPNCGYNLRGLSGRQPCPECGSLNGWNFSDEPIAFDEHPGVGAFVVTVLHVLTRPRAFAAHAWRPVWLDPKAAKRFRRTCLIIGAAALLATSLSVIVRSVGTTAALWTLPVSVPATLLWLDALASAPVRFVKKHSPGQVTSRVMTLANYISAGFVLLPLQLPLIVFNWRLADRIEHHFWIFAVVTHWLVLGLCLLPASFAYGWLIYELITVRPLTAHVMALSQAIGAMLTALVLLVGPELLIAAIVSGAI